MYRTMSLVILNCGLSIKIYTHEETVAQWCLYCGIHL